MSRLAAIGHASRLARAGFVMAREGAFVDVDPQTLPPLARAPLALANLLARRGASGLGGCLRFASEDGASGA